MRWRNKPSIAFINTFYIKKRKEAVAVLYTNPTSRVEP